MNIEFRTIKRDFYGDEYEVHEVLVDNKVYMRQAECIEPEDVRFYRDLMSPFDCERLLQEAVDAAKRGEEVKIEYTEETDK